MVKQIIEGNDDARKDAVWVIPKGAHRRDQRAVAVYQRNEAGEIVNLEVLA